MYRPCIVKVAVEQAAFHFDKLYSYVVTGQSKPIRRGCRVVVPFGGHNRKCQGVVVETDAVAEVPKLKPVLEILDDTPLLNEELLDLALWLKQRTFCTVFDAVRTMLPTGYAMRLTPTYRAAAEPDDAALLSVEEKRLIQALAPYPDGLERPKLLALLGLESDSSLPQQLVDRGLLTRTDVAAQNAAEATVRMVRLTAEAADASQPAAALTPKQAAVVQLLREAGEASFKEICYLAGVTPVVVQALIRKGVVEEYERERLRRPYDGSAPAVRTPIVLNTEQQAALDRLLELYQQPTAAAALLFGVTGSGKTQVYMQLIDRVLDSGRQVLVMVPEISLTPQVLQLFLRRYGERVAMLHSGLSIGERMDEWRRIRRGEATVVIGTRSAVFAPFSDLGLIVMDEEQEHTYKSESSPRYHARDIARYRCARHNALLLLCSATPSIESYHATMAGRYTLIRLTARYGNTALPTVEIADLRAEPAMTGAIGDTLGRGIADCLQNGQQAILLLNRRGYHTHTTCCACGEVATCPFCSVAMTYHRANHRLVCHYCGHMQPQWTRCPSCGSDRVKFGGTGTQRVEEELEQRFPTARLLRMDADTTMTRSAYETRFRAFSNGEYDIMVGTQMVAKGLDFPRVGLVGVVSADQTLYSGDFRSFETTFSLLTQVIGRAGRRDTVGRAVVQTYTPESYVIDLAARQDYERFYAVEIESRRLMKYPPYADLFVFLFAGVQEEAVRAAANRFLQDLKAAVTGRFAGVPVIVLDPMPAAVAKTSGRFRYKLLMKANNTALMRNMLAELLVQFARRPENKTVTLSPDINPASVL